MRRFKPGDQVYVKDGAYLRAVIGEEESWNVRICQGLVVSTSYLVVETDVDVSDCVAVLIAERGLFLIAEQMLMTPDEYGDPSRLFPPTRLREP